MNDVKELCELALDVPAPPLRDPRTALAVAQRATRRRDGLASAAAGLAVIVAASIVAVPVLTTARQPAPVTSAAAAPAPPKVAPPAPLPPVPTWQEAHAHGGAVTQVLLAAVPAGLQGSPEYTFTNGDHTATWQRERPSNGYGSLNSVVMSDGHRQGLLQAHLIRDETLPTTRDLCSAAFNAWVDTMFGTATNCAVLTVDGVPIRVSTRIDPDRQSVTLALRLLDGGVLAVESAQHRWNFDAETTQLPPDAVGKPGPRGNTAPGLTRQVFTPAQLATLAADPRFLP